MLESKGGEQRPLGVRPGQTIKGPLGQIKEFTVWSKSDREPMKITTEAEKRVT